MQRILKIFKIVAVCLLLLSILMAALFGYSDMPLDELKEKYAQAPSMFVAVDGMNVHYRDEGNSNDSIPIVLIHGTGASLHTFDAWAEKLKQDYRVIRMDLPAYGLTGPFANADYSHAHYVAFVKNFLNAIGIKKCVLGGNSLGGHISWYFTAQHPEMVRPVVRTSIENVYADKTKVSENLVDRYLELTLREGNRQAFIDRINSENDTTVYHRIKDIKQPSLVLWGDKDELIPLENAYRFHEDLANDTLVILKNVGHVPMEERPAESLSAVLAFLDE